MIRSLRHIGRGRHRLNRYDHLDRRVQKITPAATHTYFYDGWMLIKETVANTNGTTDVIEYHWGKDLSGTIGGAGGVGGLLYLAISNSSTPNSSTRQLYIPFYDAYGNVMGYWDTQGNVVAEYTYDAFGKLIASSGPMADVFAIRYSTKYFDPETGFYYYGYRYYSPELMRWITRDPIGEGGGVNLYAMCGNNAICHFDSLGEFKINYVTRVETALWERIRTKEKYKFVEVKAVKDIHVDTRSMNLNGAFWDTAAFVSDCQLDVDLSIWLADDLQETPRPFDVIVTKPHKTTTDGYSRKKEGGRPMKGAILAHERGHAQAFFEYQKPLFESKVSSLISKPKLTDSEKSFVEKSYKSAKAQAISDSARLANEAEKNWYVGNGFSFANEGGVYVFKYRQVASH